MAQNNRRQMSSTNRSGMSKYRHITYNGVRYYLVPQAKGTYALKTADGKLAGSTPLVSAPNYSKALSRARKIVAEIEKENSLQTGNVIEAEIITVADYELSTSKEIATIDYDNDPNIIDAEVVEESSGSELVSLGYGSEVATTGSESLDDNNEDGFDADALDEVNADYEKKVGAFQKGATVVGRRPKLVKKGLDLVENATISKGLDMMTDGISNMKQDSAKDMFLSGAAPLAGKAQRGINRTNAFHRRSIHKAKSAELHTKDKERRERLQHAKEENKKAFTHYKQQLLKAEYEKLEDVTNRLKAATESGSKYEMQKLSIEKNEVTSYINDYMRRKEEEFPNFKPPHPNLPDHIASKSDTFKARYRYGKHDRRLASTIAIDKRRANKELKQQHKDAKKTHKNAKKAAKLAELLNV